MSLDPFWIKDKSLTDTASLPPPDVLATEIADDLAATLDQFTKIAHGSREKHPSTCTSSEVAKTEMAILE